MKATTDGRRAPSRPRRRGYVFISYKREELAWADRLHQALEESGFSVWWDADLQCGQRWDEALDQAVVEADCIVVLWSERAMRSRWVAHEASVAISRRIYTPARIELTPISAPYNSHQASDLIDWDGEMNHPGLADLTRRVESLLPPVMPLWVRGAHRLRRHAATLVATAVAVLSLGLLASLVWFVSDLRRETETAFHEVMASAAYDSALKAGESAAWGWDDPTPFAAGLVESPRYGATDSPNDTRIKGS
jgi:hypothetical protein